jgi:uncharacterized delta-60 repeat protein
VQPSDQKIDVVGRAADPRSGYQDFAVTRYNTDGTLDRTFGNGGSVLTPVGHNNAYLYAIAIQPNGDIVVAGQLLGAYNSKTGDYDSSFALVRYTPTGGLDTTFGSRGILTTNTSAGRNEGINALALQANGDIVAAGWANTSTGKLMDVARYTPSGALDTTFGNGGIVFVNSFTGIAAAVAVQPTDGKIVLAGRKYASTAPYDIEALIRLNPSGALDTTFGSGGVVLASLGADQSYATSLLIQPDGKLVTSGYSADTLALGNLVLARFSPDGSLDATFGTGGDVISTAMTAGGPGAFVVEQNDGKLVVAGGRYGFTLERFTTTGQLDPTYGNGGVVYYDNSTINADPSAAAIQANGDVVVVGTVYGVARFLPSDPEINTFTASANPVTGGSSLTLTASNISDGNPNSTITQVAFYYIDSSGIQQLLGYGTQTSPGAWTFTFTVNLTSGTYTLYAQAEDSNGVFGDPFALTLTVQ